MKPFVNDECESVRRRFACFADRFIASRSDLHSRDSFPRDLWQTMAGEGLFGLGLPGRYGGMDGSAAVVAAAGEALARQGGNMGIVLSWLIHLLVARFVIHDAGNEDQRRCYLPGLASGERTAALAISEAERGGHPRYLKTRAERQGGRYILNGEKTYLTNGPIADLFVVLAVTGGSQDRKAFTAFLVPRDSPGLSPTEPLSLPFLHPAPHGGIILRDCPVPEENMLGEEGTAYERLAIPFREYEDAMMMGALAGGMEHQLMLTARALCRRTDVPGEITATLGELCALSDLLKSVACEAPAIYDRGGDRSALQPITVGFGILAQAFQSAIGGIQNYGGGITDRSLDLLTKDLVSMLSLAGKRAVAVRTKLGISFLASMDSRKGLHDENGAVPKKRKG